MFWGEVELEPEVRDWYLALEDKHRGRVDFRSCIAEGHSAEARDE